MANQDVEAFGSSSKQLLQRTIAERMAALSELELQFKHWQSLKVGAQPALQL